MIDEWNMSVEYWLRNTEVPGKTCPSVTLTTTYSQWTAMGWNHDHHSDRLEILIYKNVTELHNVFKKYHRNKEFENELKRKYYIRLPKIYIFKWNEWTPAPTKHAKP